MFESLSPEIASAMTITYIWFYVLEILMFCITIILTIKTKLKIMSEIEDAEPNEHEIIHFKNPFRIVQILLILLFLFVWPDKLQNAVINPEFTFETALLVGIPLVSTLVILPWFLLIHGLNVQVLITKQKIIVLKPWRSSKSICWEDIRTITSEERFFGTINIHTDSGTTKINEKLFWSTFSTASKDFSSYLSHYAPQAVKN